MKPAAIAISRPGSTSNATPGVAANSRSASRLWLYVTALLTLGGFATAIALAPPPGTERPAAGLAWLLFVGSSVHVASTGWLFTLPEVRGQVARHRARYLWLPAGVVLASAAVAAVSTPAVLRWLLLGFFGWQFFHFQKQNLGIASLAASSRRLRSLAVNERRALMVAGWAGIAAILARPGLLRLDFAGDFDEIVPFAAVVFIVAVAAGTLLIMSRPRQQRPGGFCLVYLMSLTFFAPAFVFNSPYSALGGMTIAHGLQYILLVALVSAAGRRGAARPMRLALLFNAALIGGAALSSASHLHGANGAGRVLFGAYLGMVMAHFLVDAWIWRLRDPFPRHFLSTRLPFLVAPVRRGPAMSATDGSVSDIE